MSNLQVTLKMSATGKFWIVTGVKDKNIKELFIPDKVDGFRVCVIGEDAFRNNLQLEYVNLPMTIDEIKSCAFAGCKNLKKIYRYHSATGIEIRDGAFANCENLSAITLNKITSIGPFAFAHCKNLTEFPFTECYRVPVIHEKAFARTKITSIILFEGQNIDYAAFLYAPINKVVVNGNITFASDFYEVLKNAKIQISSKSSLTELAYVGFCVEEFL